MKNRIDMRIYLDDYDETRQIPHRLYNIIDYVTQYRFQGGPEQPIRYLEMRVDKNNIDDAYPDLMHAIVEGKTRLLIDAVDKGTFIITKIWLNDNEYDLVATGIEITLNTATLNSILIGQLENISDPPQIVETIIDDWKSTLNLTTKIDNVPNYEIVNGEAGEEYNDDFDIYFSSSVDPDRQQAGCPISFKENMPTLVAINMCSLLDDAFVFFADRNGTNTMYYVHYGDDVPLASNPGDSENDGVVRVYPRMSSQYQTYTKFDLMMFKKLIGVSSKNSEGSETIVNNQIVIMDGGKGEAENNASKNMYGDYAGTLVSSDLMMSHPYGLSNTAQVIADNLVKRYKDPTRSITISLSEVVSNEDGSSWDMAIPPYTYAKKIIDDVNNISLDTTHLCDGTPDAFMLRLSTFIRAYPEFTSEYTFGVMKETTLSQELANKLTGMTGDVNDIRLTNGTSIVSELGIVAVDEVPSGTVVTPPHLITSKGVYDAIDGMIDLGEVSSRTFTYDSSGSSDVAGYQYPYRISVASVDASVRCNIIFAISELDRNCWSPLCKTDNDGYIWIYSRTDLGQGTVSVTCGYTLIRQSPA